MVDFVQTSGTYSAPDGTEVSFSGLSSDLGLVCEIVATASFFGGFGATMYSGPAGTAVDFIQTSGYTPPAWDAVDFPEAGAATVTQPISATLAASGTFSGALSAAWQPISATLQAAGTLAGTLTSYAPIIAQAGIPGPLSNFRPQALACFDPLPDQIVWPAFGGDSGHIAFTKPAPAGFHLIPPGTVTKAMIESTATTETLPLWDPAFCYPVGFQVSLGNGTMWEAVHQRVTTKYRACNPLYNLNKLPSSATIPKSYCGYYYAGEAWWRPITVPSNDMRMFDPSLETETQATGSLVVTVTPDFSCDAIALFGVVADTVAIEVEGLYARVWNLAYSPAMFSSVTHADSLVELWLPQCQGRRVTLSFTGMPANPIYAEGAIKVGFVCLGEKISIGFNCYETSIGILDYSQKSRDVWGNPIVRQDTYADRANYIFEAWTPELHAIKSAISEYRATPIAYIGHAEVEATWIFGLYQDFLIPVQSFTVDTGNLIVTGMPRHWDRPYDAVCESWEGKTTIGCGGDACIDATVVDEDAYGLCQTATAPSTCANAPALVTGLAADVLTGLDGQLYASQRRTPASRFYDLNITSVAYNDFFDNWGICGTRGLLAISSDGVNWVHVPGYEQHDFVKILACHDRPPGYSNQTKMYVAFTACGTAVFSFDGGDTWKYDVEIVAITEKNPFDKTSNLGVYDVWEDPHVFGFDGHVHLLASTPDRVFFKPSYVSKWNKALNIPLADDTRLVEGLVIGERIFLTSGDTIVHSGGAHYKHWESYSDGRVYYKLACQYGALIGFTVDNKMVDFGTSYNSVLFPQSIIDCYPGWYSSYELNDVMIFNE